jgi:hypothetical protein
MLEETNGYEPATFERWLTEMKDEMNSNARVKAKEYNFDFEENCPGRLPGSRLHWQACDGANFRVGNLRPRQESCELKFNYESLAILRSRFAEVLLNN